MYNDEGPSGGTIVSGGFEHTFSNVEQVVLRGNGGSDTATLYGSAGADRAVRRPSADSGLVSLRDEAGTYLLKVLDFETVALRGEGGSDTVEIHGETDGANQFQFSAASLHAVMDSGTVTTTADGFETVYATVRGRGGVGWAFGARSVNSQSATRWANPSSTFNARSVERRSIRRTSATAGQVTWRPLRMN